MLKYVLATSLTLYIEKYCYSYLNGLADLWRWFFTYSNPPRTKGRAYFVHVFLTTTKNFNEIQRSILLIMIIWEILLFIFIYFDFGN